jgi:branched-chain amino acid transport system ATP-binding protein
MLLETKNLSVSYGPIDALKQVNLKVSEGKIVTVLGPNGAGKSTLLKAISGIVPVYSGSIHYLGQDINSLNPQKRVKNGIAQVMEGRRLFGDQSVYHNLEIGAFHRFRKQKSEAIKKDMDRFFTRFPRLKEREDQLAKTLSGGEQQMLVFSMAMMSSPKLLLLDEPSLGLAPKVVADLFDFIVEVKNEGIGVILVEQMANLALEIADYGYVLEQGKIVAEGSGVELLEDAQSGRLKELYFSTN